MLGVCNLNCFLIYFVCLLTWCFSGCIYAGSESTTYIALNWSKTPEVNIGIAHGSILLNEPINITNVSDFGISPFEIFVGVSTFDDVFVTFGTMELTLVGAPEVTFPLQVSVSITHPDDTQEYFDGLVADDAVSFSPILLAETEQPSAEQHSAVLTIESVSIASGFEPVQWLSGDYTGNILLTIRQGT